MKTTKHLYFNEHGDVVSVLTEMNTPPRSTENAVCVTLTVNIPDEYFERPVFNVEITAPTMEDVTPAVMDAWLVGKVTREPVKSEKARRKELDEARRKELDEEVPF